MNDDAALLRRYADEGSQSAFTELVHRHVDLVYGAALRRTNSDPHLAADVAQQVFTALARDARKLSRHTVISAWLHTATRNAALNLMISESRRQAREQTALDPALNSSATGPQWEHLRPVIDAAIDELPEADRAAVVLRFLERRAFAQIGAALQVSEDAARMRLERALEKLRAGLARRGITSTAAALGAIVSNQPLVSAPVGLAATLAAQSLATVGAGAGLVAALISFMNLKLVTGVALSALVAFLVGNNVGAHRVAAIPPPSETPPPAAVIAALRQDNESLKAELSGLHADIAKLTEANAALGAQKAATPPVRAATLGWAPRYEQQRMILNSLRQITAARDQFELENKRPPASIRELVGLDAYIKTVRPIAGEDYSGLTMLGGQPLSVTTADGMTVTYDPNGLSSTPVETPPEVVRAEDLGRKVGPAVQKATEAYRLSNPGLKGAPKPQALMAYFSNPQDGADFLEMLEAQKAAFAAQLKAPR